jgi:alkylation response protein AidB-like acyl-CoA dehydrogenase
MTAIAEPPRSTGAAEAAPSFELQAATPQGRRLVAMAEEFAPALSAAAAANDREGKFSYESLELLKRAGYLYAPVPEEAGGMGVTSAHDLLVASTRLARADASLALGVNMHLNVLFALSRQYYGFRARGDEARAAGTAVFLRQIVESGQVIAAAVSEPDQKLTWQATTAIQEGGEWVINGRKIISSMASAATLFSVSVNYVDENGSARYAYVLVPRDTPGLTVHDDWDALGMRSSASVSVTFENCRLPGRGPGRGAPAGVYTAEYLEPVMMSGLAHASASLGVAEAAQALALGAIEERRRKRGDQSVRPTLAHFAAENSIDLAAARAIFGRAAEGVDAYYAETSRRRGSDEAAFAVFAEAQRAKAFVNQASVRIVDRAMTMAGGAAFMNAHPLSRLYRDARAGAFMHPLGANVAYEFIGAVTLGMQPPAL